MIKIIFSSKGTPFAEYWNTGVPVTSADFVLELNDHDFDGFVPDVDVLMPSFGSIGVEPVCLPGLPLMYLTLTRLFENLHRSAAQRDDYARVFMSMQRQGIIG